MPGTAGVCHTDLWGFLKLSSSELVISMTQLFRICRFIHKIFISLGAVLVLLACTKLNVQIGAGRHLSHPVSVDLRVSRIYRHLAASPSFGGQIAGAGRTPRLSYLPFQTMEMPLDDDNTKDS